MRLTGQQTGGNDNTWTNLCVGYRTKSLTDFTYHQENTTYITEFTWLAIGT